MRTYLINLARRRDRLDAMAAQLGALGVDFVRVEALDAGAVPESEIEKWFDAGGPLGVLPRGDKCCTLSHRRAWELFVESGAPYAAVLEDDVVLAPGGAALLKDSGWIAPDIGLVKLEQYGPPDQRILIGETSDIAPGFRIARLHSRHTGAAAYVISRGAAQMLLGGVRRYALPVDHLLFNPNNSPVCEALGPWQLIPAIAKQQQFVGEKSDIEGWRVGMRKWSWTFIRREIIRAGYELRLAPKQLLSLVRGQTRLVRIGTD
jgi:glycosyl transferase family 25